MQIRAVIPAQSRWWAYQRQVVKHAHVSRVKPHSNPLGRLVARATDPATIELVDIGAKYRDHLVVYTAPGKVRRFPGGFVTIKGR
jgi:hypothetical protein